MSQSCLVWVVYSTDLLVAGVLHVEYLYGILPVIHFLFVKLVVLALIGCMRKYLSRWQNNRKRVIRHTKVGAIVRLVSLFVSGWYLYSVFILGDRRL